MAFHWMARVLHGKSMVRLQSDDRKWAKVAAILAEKRAQVGEKFVESVLWWRRTGAPWRDLPAELGPWKTVFNRFDRWSKKGTGTGLFQALQAGTGTFTGAEQFRDRP